jgi:Streptomyces sporulation and cell division protein, SsgA
MTALHHRTAFLFKGNGTDPTIPGIPVTADLAYNPADPYVVLLTFPQTVGEPITWMLSRETLTEGLTAPAGIGDIHIAPTPARLGYIEVILRSEAQPACFTVLASIIREFLISTYDVVPAGREMDHIDVDAALVDLLGEEAT